jgi:hypothetical protein
VAEHNRETPPDQLRQPDAREDALGGEGRKERLRKSCSAKRTKVVRECGDRVGAMEGDSGDRIA